MKIAIVLVAGSPAQNLYLWPSLSICSPGTKCDYIIVHRDSRHLPETIPSHNGDTILVNKCGTQFPGGELEHKAFGAYRYVFQNYFSDYDVFGFVSDDVVFRRDNWLSDTISLFEEHEQIGFISPLLYNNPKHIRAPIWFARTTFLKKVNWEFTSDNHGEVTIADKLVSTGAIGIQIGHKIDFAYDPQAAFPEFSRNMACKDPGRICGDPHPLFVLDRMLFGSKKILSRLDIDSMDRFKEMLFQNKVGDTFSSSEAAPSIDNQHYNICLEIQPYHKLIYNGCLNLARQCGIPMDVYESIHKLGPPVQQMRFDVAWPCLGVSPSNPIAIMR